MAKEYIEREAAISAVHKAWAKGLEPTQYIEDIPAADVIEVFRGEDSVLAEFEDDYKDFEKIKTHIARIIVGGKVEKPCYSILWWDEESKEYNIGYSSYCLDYVRKWLELVFEVVENIPTADCEIVPTIEAETVNHARWEKCENDGFEWYQCSRCQNRPLNDFNERPALSDYCPHCRAKMDGGADHAVT